MSSAQLPQFDTGSSRADKITAYKSWLKANPGHKQREHVLELVLEEHVLLLGEKDATIQVQGATIQEQGTTIQEQGTIIKERSLVSVREKFPALMDRTTSGAHFPKNHEHADVIEEEKIDATKIHSIVEAWMDSDFWGAAYLVPGSDNCDSEVEAQTFVNGLICAVLRGLKLDHVIEVVQNKTLAGTECDLLLVYKPNRLPFAVVEVKKPANTDAGRKLIFHGDENKGRNRISGQVHDEMMAVKLFGFQKVFGMIATGNNWRLVGTASLITENDPENLKPETLRKRLLQRPGGDPEEDTETTFHISPGQSEVKFVEKENGGNGRQIFASKIVPDLLSDGVELKAKVEKSGEEIVQLVTFFVLKASLTLVDLLERQCNPWNVTIHRRMASRVLTTDENIFNFSTVTLKNVNQKKYNVGLQKIHVILHLGSGGNGSCCLGVSEGGGSCCAIKFFHPQKPMTKEELANQEFKNWETVYGNRQILPNCRLLNVAGGPCLVMPYLRPIPLHDRPKFLENGQIEKALSYFAKSGYIHNDIKWRHLGLWVDDQGQDIICLMDLGDVVQAKAGDILAWQQKSMECLSASAGGVVSAATPVNEQKRKRHK